MLETTTGGGGCSQAPTNEESTRRTASKSGHIDQDQVTRGVGRAGTCSVACWRRVPNSNTSRQLGGPGDVRILLWFTRRLSPLRVTVEQMSDVGQHLLSGICILFNVEVRLVNFFPQVPFPDSLLPSFFNRVRPSRLTRLVHPHDCASRPHKDTSSARRCRTQNKVGPLCSRENPP